MSSDNRDSRTTPQTDIDGSSARSNDQTTRERIMEAAIRILARDGMKGMTTRAIAREARVNQALINYHYRTKDNLLLEMSRVLDTEKYARQTTMYYEPGVPLSAKWRQAIEFYRRDLADGYIRLNKELIYLGFTNPEIAQSTRERLFRWRALLEEVAAAYLPDLEIDVSPRYVADVICSFWYGMDERLMLVFPADEETIFEILDYIGDWLEERERQYGIFPDANEGHCRGPETDKED
jgi:AcrR family transcriptional regulator